MRFGFLVVAFMPVLGWAGECEDDFSECQDDCMVQFGGSVRDDKRAKFNKCYQRCTTKSAACLDQAYEMKVNQLNQGALDKGTSSRDVDEYGMPNLKRADDKRPAEKRRDEKRADDKRPEEKRPEEKRVEETRVEPKRERDHGDDLRDDLPTRSTPVAEKVAPEPKAKKKKKELADDEVVRSDRTRLADPPAPSPAPVKKADPPTELSDRGADRDRPPERDRASDRVPDRDRPEPPKSVTAREPEPEPAPPPKRLLETRDDPKPSTTKPKKEDDHDDLRNY